MRRWLGERGLEARSPHVAERFLAPRLSDEVANAPALVAGLDGEPCCAIGPSDNGERSGGSP